MDTEVSLELSSYDLFSLEDLEELRFLCLFLEEETKHFNKEVSKLKPSLKLLGLDRLRRCKLLPFGDIGACSGLTALLVGD
jgi:hypothetical protein